MHGQGVKAVKVDTRRIAGEFRIHFQNEQLLLAIEHRLSRKQNVGADDSVDFLLVQQARSAIGTAKIDNHDRFLDQV